MRNNCVQFDFPTEFKFLLKYDIFPRPQFDSQFLVLWFPPPSAPGKNNHSEHWPGYQPLQPQKQADITSLVHTVPPTPPPDQQGSCWSHDSLNSKSQL